MFQLTHYETVDNFNHSFLTFKMQKNTAFGVKVLDVC